jgi:hypothetical protein
MKRRIRLVVAALMLALVGGAGSTETASAGVWTTDCGPQLFEQPFLPWLDPFHYVLAPDGGFEGGAAGWTLTGGAQVVAGNEPYHVRSAADERSLSLPMGSSATSPPMCLGVDGPTARLFVSNSGSLLSTLRVEVVSRNALGLKTSVPVAVLFGTRTWQPTLPFPVLANLTSLALVTNETTHVSFRFTPVGVLGGWKIDDVYVDPFKGT